MAPTTAAARSAPVEAMTRAVKVEALKPWSMVRMRYCSTARTWAGSASTSGEHPQVVGRIRQVRAGGNGGQAPTQAVDGGEDGGHHGTEAEGLGPSLVGAGVEAGGPAQLGTEQSDRGPEGVQG